jgi:mannose-6-phosphate isomerase-like protein (cupin superfamily)
VRPARDGGWRRLAPGFDGCVELLRAGLPFQIVAGRRYDRRGDPRRLAPALAAGATVYLPQAHEVLPRVMRLVVALRAGLLGPLREECSFLFLVDGRGREGMGLHHDGPVDAVWIQLAGRRRVTIGPPVPPGTPADLDDGLAAGGGAGWRTLDLAPGSLFYLPPRTPHRVICRGRSLALSLTWGPPRRRASAAARARSLVRWPVAAGQALGLPPARRDRLWSQVPAVPEGRERDGRLRVRAPGGVLRLPAAAGRLAPHLAAMPEILTPPGRPPRAWLEPWLAPGVLGPRDLPLAIRPAAPRRLEGWRFA